MFIYNFIQNILISPYSKQEASDCSLIYRKCWNIFGNSISIYLRMFLNIPKSSSPSFSQISSFRKVSDFFLFERKKFTNILLKYVLEYLLIFVFGKLRANSCNYGKKAYSFLRRVFQKHIILLLLPSCPGKFMKFLHILK